MTKRAATKVFAQRILSQAMAVGFEQLPSSDILSSAMELGLIRVRKVRGDEARDLGCDPGTEVYDFEKWMEPRLA